LVRREYREEDVGGVRLDGGGDHVIRLLRDENDAHVVVARLNKHLLDTLAALDTLRCEDIVEQDHCERTYGVGRSTKQSLHPLHTNMAELLASQLARLIIIELATLVLFREWVLLVRDTLVVIVEARRAREKHDLVDVPDRLEVSSVPSISSNVVVKRALSLPQQARMALTPGSVVWRRSPGAPGAAGKPRRRR
jgi:hypothetical protein